MYKTKKQQLLEDYASGKVTAMDLINMITKDDHDTPPPPPSGPPPRTIRRGTALGDAW